MSNQTPAPNDDVPRTPSAEDAIRNDYGIDPQNDPVASENDTAKAETEEASDEESDPSTPQGNRYSPDDIEPESQAERTEGKPVDADVDTDGG
jgi:hypothetical protein